MFCSIYEMCSENNPRSGTWSNALAHSALSVQEVLDKNGMTVVLHPPYSPNMVPWGFFIFPDFKLVMKI